VHTIDMLRKKSKCLLVELRRDESGIASVDRYGFTTTTGRRINRLQLQEDAAPRVEPFRSNFFARLPAIPSATR
jgi:hypothetical protein